MKARQGLIEIFSSFLQLQTDSSQGWITDPRLRRSMEQQLSQSADRDSSPHLWALYWHRTWQTAQTQAQAQAPSPRVKLPEGHLAAYLQEVCFWTAKKLHFNFSSQQSIADLFQSAIVNLPKVLSGFNPQYSTNLKGYAEFTFSNLMKDALRRGQEVNICTDWALLHKVSQKRLVESLQMAGLNGETIAAYVLAWRGFRELATPSDAKALRRLPKPSPETWQAIATFYQTQKTAQLGSQAPMGSAEAIEKWMLAAAKAVRMVQFPTVVSANVPKPGQETGELMDSLPGQEESLMAEWVAEEELAERMGQKQALGEVLQGAIGGLDAQMQELLRVYYGEGLTQQQLAERLGMKQYTVSRRLTTVRGKLLQALAKWSQERLHVSLTSDVLEAMNAMLEDWLKQTLHPQ
ncbi:MAG: sigma-70 family RNA polymerase sigma factor [Synechococcales bacterium]|nr:sigma-70 family RNA polymerase sigma factor [Synechococcales bacterium]